MIIYFYDFKSLLCTDSFKFLFLIQTYFKFQTSTSNLLLDDSI